MRLPNFVLMLRLGLLYLGKIPLVVPLSQSALVHQPHWMLRQHQGVRAGLLRPACASTSADCVVDAFNCYKEIDCQGQEVLRLYGCCHSNHFNHWLLLAVLRYRLCKLSSPASALLWCRCCPKSRQCYTSVLRLKLLLLLLLMVLLANIAV
jgi:hypothetical protein